MLKPSSCTIVAWCCTLIHHCRHFASLRYFFSLFPLFCKVLMAPQTLLLQASDFSLHSFCSLLCFFALLTEKSKEAQVNTLIHCMGDHADDILPSFKLSEEDSEKYKVVKDKFKGHFVKRRNVIYEQAKFNTQKQERGKPVDVFITILYTLAEHCN